MNSAKKKHVRFAAMDYDDNDEQEEDTLFDQRQTDGGRGLKGVLKPAKRSPRAGGQPRVEVADTRGARCGRWMTTAALCASFLGLGMSIAVIGPTFEDLALNVHKNISNISYIFAGRSAGYIGGSLLGGALFDCMDPNLLLGLSMLLTAVGMCAIPLCRQALLLTALMACIGISMGVLDTGGNVLVLNTWGDQAGPHMQALHFSFAAGAVASPIIAQLLFGAHGNRSSPPENGTHSLVEYVQTRSSLRSMWAYEVIGLFVFLSALLFFCLYCCGAASRERETSSSERPPVAKQHSAIVALLFFFYFAYVGSEVAYGSFIFTFTKDFVHLGEGEAVGVNTLFWGCFAACRGLGIPLAACVSPGWLITLSLLSCCVSSLLLALFPLHRTVLWAGTGLYGASMAVVFPSGLSWAEQYTSVTGRTAAVLVVGAALGEMVLPVLLGFLMGRVHGEPLLMYQAVACAVFCSVLFPVMHRLVSPQRGKPLLPRPEADGDGEFRQALLESEDQDDQWNEADFEVIEMDDALSSPCRGPCPDGAGSGALSSSEAFIEESPLHRQKRD